MSPLSDDATRRGEPKRGHVGALQKSSQRVTELGDSTAEDTENLDFLPGVPCALCGQKTRSLTLKSEFAVYNKIRPVSQTGLSDE